MELKKVKAGKETKYELTDTYPYSLKYPISAEDMTRDELLAMIGWIFKYRDTFSICFGGNSATLFERKR